jgi:hypothetical protein
MVRFRNAVIAFALATGMTGCSAFHGEGNWLGRWSIFHCDSCDDFPAPAYGPGYSMMPGTYTGAATPGSGGPDQPAASTPPAGAMPGMTPPAAGTPPAANTTPPSPPAAPPGPGADAREPASGLTEGSGMSVAGTDAGLPVLPAVDQSHTPVSFTDPASADPH